MMDDDDDDVVPGSYREQQLPGGAGVFKTWLTCARQEQGEQQVADRELLELAAKAAGVFITRDEWPYSDAPTDEDFALRFDEKTGTLTGPVLVYNYDGELSGTTHEEWNPLTDDGDALRLAVKLGLDVFNRPSQFSECGRVGTQGFREKHGTDPYAAARRAIVKAAAELGRSVR